MNWTEFLAWERADNERVNFKVAYVDITGDLIAGLMLSQIVYWNLPSKSGQSKLRVYKHGEWWLAKSKKEWWDECRVTVRQVDRALTLLEKLGFIECKIYKFSGTPTLHIRLNEDKMLSTLMDSITTKAQNGLCGNSRMESAESAESLTDTTTDTTTLEVSSETSAEQPSRHQTKKPAPTAGEESPLEKIMSKKEWRTRRWELGELFAEKTKVVIPKRRWAEMNKRWWSPLEDIVVAGGDMSAAKDVIEKAIELHIKKGWQLASPQSIKQVAISFAGELKRNGAQSTGGWKQG